jgi:hypothetical protein
VYEGLTAILYLHGLCLADSGIDTSKVFIILYRDQTIQCPDSQRCVFPGLIPAFTIRPTGCPQGINPTFCNSFSNSSVTRIFAIYKKRNNVISSRCMFMAFCSAIKYR